jgi:hypothetical protein
MVLRIKELLYEDQYTIAGAKKKLTSEIRGASKLKVVTPEMAAAAAEQAETAQQQHPAPAGVAQSFAPPQPTYASDTEPAPREPEYPVTDERRAALRRLREQMRDLLSLLDSRAGATPDPRRK